MALRRLAKRKRRGLGRGYGRYLWQLGQIIEYIRIKKLQNRKMCATLLMWETIEPGGYPLFRRDITLQTKERRALLMMITYADFVQTGIFIVALIGLCYTIFREKRK